jgi:hypothetical protein
MVTSSLSSGIFEMGSGTGPKDVVCSGECLQARREPGHSCTDASQLMMGLCPNKPTVVENLCEKCMEYTHPTDFTT